MIGGIILIKLLVAHFVGDFILQPGIWVRNKQKNRWKSASLYFHAFIHGALAYILVLDLHAWRIFLWIFLSHLIIDIGKSIYKKDNTTALIFDQLLHIAFIVIIWLGYTSQWSVFFNNTVDLFYKPFVWLVLLGYLLCLAPFGFLIGKMTKSWQEQLKDDGNEGLDKAGLYIGFLERVLVFTFFIINQYAAIGFLLAAKSIFRFGDQKDSSDRKRTEYILFGTFRSFTLAVLIGVGVKMIIRFI